MRQAKGHDIETQVYFIAIDNINRTNLMPQIISNVGNHCQGVVEVLGNIFFRHCHLNVHPIGIFVENDIAAQSPAISQDTYKRHQFSFSCVFPENHFQVVILQLCDEGLNI